MAGQSKSYQFRQECEATWQRLEELVKKAEKNGVKALSADEALELPQLYSGTLSGLSVAQAISLDMNVVRYLEGLCARAYFILYGTHETTLETVRDFIAYRLPRAVRGAWQEILVSALVLLIGVLVGLLLTLSNPDWFYTFVDSRMASGRTPMASTEELKSVIDGSADKGAQWLDVFSTFLFTHNAQVGILAFALGIAFGLPTLYLLFTNETTLGAFIALYASRDLTIDLIGWLMVHGTTEIFAIILCGAAGLIIGRHLAFPGTLGRMENLSKNGKNAALIVVGAIFMFLVAGLLEGFARQLITDTGTRLIIASAMLFAWLAYYMAAGFSDEQMGEADHGDAPDQ